MTGATSAGVDKMRCKDEGERRKEEHTRLISVLLQFSSDVSEETERYASSSDEIEGGEGEALLCLVRHDRSLENTSTDCFSLHLISN